MDTPLLEKRPTLTFEEIAKALNRKKAVIVPPGANSWTVELVRRAYVS